MDKNTSVEFCKKTVKSFIEKYCDSDIEKLLCFDIQEIEKDDNFGRPVEYREEWKFDPDDSIIVRSVLYLIYNDIIPDLSYDLIGNKYRGDTIFTQGNIFGRKREFLDKQNIADTSLYMKKAIEFVNKYHTIPNIMLLPNEKTELLRKNKISKETLNQYRGLNNPGLRDYIDLFVLEVCNSIDKCNIFERDSNIDLLVQENSFYFNNFQKGIEFLKNQFLDDLVCKSNDKYELIDDYKLRHVVYWKKTSGYDKAIDKFLNAFDRLWAYRKEKMLNKLKKIFED